MPIVKFIPSAIPVEVDPNTKILVAAKRGKVAIRFGCAACRCGTCAVRVSPSSAFVALKPAEEELLLRMKLPVDGQIRLSCQARIQEDCQVDIRFQDEYSPDNE